MATSGIDIRQTTGRLIFRALLLDGAGERVSTGTTTLYLYRQEDDGTLASFDFADAAFKTTALTTETLALTHRPGNAAATPTGIWTAALASLGGFAAGGVYYALAHHESASPRWQAREFQFGGGEGDLFVDAAGRVQTSNPAGGQPHVEVEFTEVRAS